MDLSKKIAIVTFDYDAKDEDELTLRLGDVLTNLKPDEEGWCMGSLNERTGVFPDNFVKVVDDFPASVNPVESTRKKGITRRMKVTFSYKRKDDDELDLVVGDIIDVLTDVEEGWAIGCLKGRKGVFPINFAELYTEGKSSNINHDRTDIHDQNEDPAKTIEHKKLNIKIQSLDRELVNYKKKIKDLEDKNKAKDEELRQKNTENQNLKNEISQMKQDEKNKILISTFIPSHRIFAVKGEEGFLGRGRFGCVRLGFTDPHGPVAIKCIPVVGSRASIKQTHDRIMEEIRHTKLSSNINVVRVEGYTHWPGAAAIVVEYMPGGDLHTFLTGRGTHGYEIPSIPAVIRLRFCADVTSGITFLHFGFFSDQRLTHGDLKSQNVLLSTDLRCKVSDFGGASFATSTNADPAPGKGKEFTAVYASPERLLNPGLRTSKKMDVYSTSMIIHEVVTRKPPFDVRMSRQDLISHVAHLGNRPSLGVEELKQSLDDEEDVNIISLMQEEMVRCWSQHPEDRPSIMEVRDKFVGALLRKDQPIIAQHVADITKEMEIEIPDRREFEGKCAPIGLITSHDLMLR
ncbi:receptor-interacting serine/threonine-protein kinase 1-like [Clavelina lepadiformis]|uniref:receptor-interacting serine/threonine-protein kinase 1-like n=1 Tax=Clavelina lepadiformis TaxID=159417 RepID=UPI00404353F7